MPALILKSKSTLNSNVASLEYAIYRTRVLSDGGRINNDESLRDAFQFIKDNNIPIESVYSATSADWGVKTDKEGKPLKLYSLGSSDGDIYINTPIGSGVDISNQDSKNVLSFTAVSNSSAKTTSPTKDITNFVSAVSAKAANLSDAASYGNGTDFYRYVLLPPSASPNTVDRGALTFYRRANTSSHMSTAETRFHANGNKSLDTLSANPLAFSSDAIFANNSGHKIYVNGSLAVNKSFSVTLPKNMILSLGNAHEYMPSVALYGFISEAWVVVNTQESVAQALSARLASI